MTKEQTRAKPARNSAVEMLRIIAMLFIVMSHSSVHGGFGEAASQIAFNNFFLDWMVLGNLGVAIFVLIAGYFLCEKAFRVQPVLRLWSQVFFYSILGTVIFVLAGNRPTLIDLITAVFPTVYAQFWFFTAYFVLLLLSPYINIVISHLDRKQHFTLLAILLTLWCVTPTLTKRGFYGNELPQFLMFYVMGAYLRKYPDNALKLPVVRYWLAAGSGVLLLASSAVLRLISRYALYFYERNSLLTVGCALGLFAVAVYMRPWSSKWINAVSSCVFGVYLFHDHLLVRRILWQDWIGNAGYYDAPILPIRMLVSVLAVFASGVLIEAIRQKYLSRPMLRAVESAYAAAKAPALYIFTKAKERIASLEKTE
ncbi:MAG: acyltransferase [Clostridia bacterium]|nr:acyltransferase [Clostridia bacterium]